MARDGSGVYSLPAGTTVAPNTTIQSSWANALTSDVAQTFNTVQPIVYGGTGEATAGAAADALSPAFVNVASGATTNIGAATSPNVNITGTTAITAFDNVDAGIKRFVKFAAELTLTHNATSLILPGGATITTAAGDTAIFISEGSGNWRCLAYSRGAAVPPRTQSWELVETRSLSGASDAAFTGLGIYRSLRITYSLTLSVDNIGLTMLTSTNGGSSYDSGASDYTWSRIQTVAGTVSGSNNNASATLFIYTGAVGNASGEGVCGTIQCYDFNQSLYGRFEVTGSNQDASGLTRMFSYSQLRVQAAARNAFKITPDSGTISGVITVEGIRG